MQIYVFTVMFVHVGALVHQSLVAVRRIKLLVGLTSVGLLAQSAVLGIGALAGLTRTWAAWSAVAGQATVSLLMLVGSCWCCGSLAQT